MFLLSLSFSSLKSFLLYSQNKQINSTKNVNVFASIYFLLQTYLYTFLLIKGILFVLLYKCINLHILRFQLFTSLHYKIQTDMLFQWKIQIRRLCITICGCIHPLVEHTVYSEHNNNFYTRSNSFQKAIEINYIYIHFLFLNFKSWQPEWCNGADRRKRPKS